MQGVEALKRWSMVNDAEEAIESGAPLDSFDAEIIEKAKANVAYRRRADARKAELLSSLPGRVDALIESATPSWSHFTAACPEQSVILSGFDECPATEAVRRFMADKDLRLLVLFGGVGCGKTLAAMTGAWLVQKRITEARLRERFEDFARRDVFPGLASAASVDEWWNEHASWQAQHGRPAREWALWQARDLAVMWDPWKVEVEAGHEPARRDHHYIVLDDLGTERESDRFHEALGAFVDYRMLGRFKTVITTNLAKPDIRARYGDRIADRINHVGKAFVVGGGTRRRNGAGL